MRKIILLFIIIIGLISCKKNTVIVDYFAQTEPENTPIVFAEDIISVKGRFEHGISFTPDSRELAFGIFNKEDFSGNIYYSKKSDNKWTTLKKFEPLQNESVYLPYFAPNGNSLLYAQSKPDTNSYFTDIWMLKRINDLWAQPVKIGSPISSLSRESTACMTLNNTIYFSSNRDGNGLADLYCSSLENGAYKNVERIDSICSVRDEESIFIAPDERYIIFSRYATNDNGPDLFISYRDFNGNWNPPTLLDSTINTADWERRPFVSIDNKFLFFTRQFFDDKGLTESDIYWVNTQKVFKPFVFNPITVKPIKLEKETELSIPIEYFSDIDSKDLKINLKQGKFDWIKFDNEKMTLTMQPNKVGEFDLIFTAIDEFSNETENKIKIIVEK